MFFKTAALGAEVTTRTIGACRALRYADIVAITSKHYADKKNRTAIGMDHLLGTLKTRGANLLRDQGDEPVVFEPERLFFKART